MSKEMSHISIFRSKKNSVLTEEQIANSNFIGLKSIASMGHISDLMFISFILFHEGGNANGDYIIRDEMEGMWPTFAGKPITWEHGEPYIGFITDSALVKPGEDSPDPRWYVECAGVIWKARYPDKASLVYEGARLGTYRTSFEIYFQNTLYMLGDDQKNLYTEEEAPYLATLVGRQYAGEDVWRVLLDCTGGGAGITHNPADKDALILSAASKENQESSLDVQINYELCVAHVSSTEQLINHHHKEKEVCNVMEEMVKELNSKVASLQEELKNTQAAKEEVESSKKEVEATVSELEQAKAELEEVKSELESRLAEVEAEYASYKEQVETEKAEAAKDALAQERLAELAKAGVELSEEQVEKWVPRFREMDNDSYADIRDLLVANVKKEEPSEVVASEEEDNLPDSHRTALASLNIESRNPSLVEKYAKMWEVALEQKDN